MKSHQVSDSGKELFDIIYGTIPVGSGKKNRNIGCWENVPDIVSEAYQLIKPSLSKILDNHSKISHKNICEQLGTLGSGNHYISINIDENDNIWIMLHSGSRGIGNKIGTYFIELARKDIERQNINLPNRDLAYFQEGSKYFNDYIEAVSWAQEYAKLNRELMMRLIIKTIKNFGLKFQLIEEAIQCHHNFVQKEVHFGKEMWITRKGAVQAKKNQLGIIPGCMGGKSYIVKGKGNKDSFDSCSHGAGRVMSRTKAKESITLKMHREATDGVFCRKDKDVIDESPAAYKDIDSVIAAQSDLIDVIHSFKEIINIKG